MRTQYPASGSISVWVGNFSDDNDMDRITDEIVESSLKLNVPLSSICEVTFEGRSIPVRNLLEGFSGWETFVDAACEAAALNGVTHANGALVCYHLLCDASFDHWPEIFYLGTLQGQDVS